MRKIMKKYFYILLVLSTIIPFFNAREAAALQPTLLWEKKLPFSMSGLGMASGTGEVLLGSREARKVILYDNAGRERSIWGPRVDREPYRMGITADGRNFYFVSAYTDAFIEKTHKDTNDARLHYLNRNGKEIWSRPLPVSSDQADNVTKSYISPDGRYLAFCGAPGEGGDIELWDIQTSKRLWLRQSPPCDDFAFSPDTAYLVADWGSVIELIDMAGNTLFKENAGFIITSVSNGANYISTAEAPTDVGVRLLDKQGNIVLQGGPKDYTLVSANGTRAILWDQEGLKVYSLPDKTILRRYLIKIEDRQKYFYPATISADGRFIALAGSKMNANTTNNFFVIDTVADAVWETTIQNPKYLETYLTDNGKYLLIYTGQDTALKLYYYQLY